MNSCFLRQFRHCILIGFTTVFLSIYPQLALAAPKEKTNLSYELSEELKQGLLAFQKEQFDLASEFFLKVANEAPDNPVGYTYLATVRYRQNKLTEAQTLLHTATTLDLNDKQAWLTLGIVCYELKQYDEALSALTRATFLDPDNARAHGYLGIVIGEKGWLSGAEQELRKAIDLDPNYANANFNLALIYLQRNPPAKELARRHYQRALELGAEPDQNIEKDLKLKSP